jgi:uncharacterized protein YjeT (DUF2065 family)
MWDELLTAVALILVVEGVLPFLNPAYFRRVIALIGQMDNLTLRIGGLISMALGVALLYVLKN